MAVTSAKWHTILRVLTVLVLCCLDSTNAAGGHAWRWASQGQSCTSGCGGSGSTCIETDIYDKVDSVANFHLAKGRMGCDGYRGDSWSGAPYKAYGYCYYHNGGTSTCSASYSNFARLCPCLCVAGTFSESDLATTCTRYDSTASGCFSKRALRPVDTAIHSLSADTSPADRPPRPPPLAPPFLDNDLATTCTRYDSTACFSSPLGTWVCMALRSICTAGDGPRLTSSPADLLP
jgi:hypothetical protein